MHAHWSPALLLAAAISAQAPPASWLDSQSEELLALYRTLHQNPELSFQERATSARMAEELGRAGLEVTRNVGGLGVVGVLVNGAGRTGLLRADMDALPIAEQTGLPFASKVQGKAGDGQPIGVMHACGHDVHMATLVGAARWFAAHKEQWSGTLVFVAQPAEERAGGMRAMVRDGLLTRFPRPEWALALHCDPMLPTGSVGLREGPLMASVDSVDLRFFGKGGHGAMPHLTIDPIVLAAHFVLAAQTIVSREVDPVQPCVLTVGAIHGGTKHNIVPDHCDLQLTMRTYDEAVREQIKKAIVRMAEGLAETARAPKPVVEFSEPTGPLVNDDAIVRKARTALQEALGAENVRTAAQQMVAEDFGQLTGAGVPLCMFRLGTITKERLAMLVKEGKVPALHTGTYWPDAKDAIETGVKVMVAAARRLLTR